jgi:hypothetical protein
MSNIFFIFYVILLLIIWIIAGGYVTQANVYLRSYKGLDDNLMKAYSDTYKAAFVTWFIVALVFLIIVLAVAGVITLFATGVGEVAAAGEAAEGAEAAEEAEEAESKNKFSNFNLSWVTIIFLVIAIALTTTTGVFAALAANNISESPNYNSNIYKLKKSYDNCLIAAVLSLGAVGLLVVGVLTYYIYQSLLKSKKANQENIGKTSNPTATNIDPATLNELLKKEN